MNSIFISGYKSFKAVELKLNPINILIGANGSGKSNFLSFFEMLHCIYEKRLTEYVALNGGTERFFHKGLKVTDMIFLQDLSRKRQQWIPIEWSDIGLM